MRGQVEVAREVEFFRFDVLVQRRAIEHEALHVGHLPNDPGEPGDVLDHPVANEPVDEYRRRVRFAQNSAQFLKFHDHPRPM